MAIGIIIGVTCYATGWAFAYLHNNVRDYFVMGMITIAGLIFGACFAFWKAISIGFGL